VKLNDVPPFFSRGGTASARTSGPSGPSGDAAATPHVFKADAVQLTLGHDGIWHVPAAPESDTSFPRPAHRSPFQPPRLASFVEPRYAPTGRLQASPLTPGLMLDIYVYSAGHMN
jgi:hypothetical protein